MRQARHKRSSRQRDRHRSTMDRPSMSSIRPPYQTPSPPDCIRYVDHSYRDYSQYIQSGGEIIKHKKSTNNFPARLHRMLSDEGHSDIITWMVRRFRALTSGLRFPEDSLLMLPPLVPFSTRSPLHPKAAWSSVESVG